MRELKNILYGQTKIDSLTLEETAPQMTDSFPFRSDCTDLHDYRGHVFPWHWHSESEILMIIEGRLRFLTTTHTFDLKAGDIIFITGGILHSTQAYGELPALHKEYIFSPMLIAGAPGSEIDRKYVSPVLRAKHGPILLPADSAQNMTVSPLLEQAYAYYIAAEDGYELHIRELMDKVWMNFRNVIQSLSAEKNEIKPREERLKSILLFIQQNYRADISVADMASAAHISERECSRCFKKQLGITPMTYLMELRVNKACAMLENTELPIGEIASYCGFSSSSYFSMLFRERFGSTPREYRMKSY